MKHVIFIKSTCSLHNGIGWITEFVQNSRQVPHTAEHIALLINPSNTDIYKY